MENNKTYSAEIIAISEGYKPSGKQRLAIKTLANAVRLDEETEKGTFVIKPHAWCKLSIHNEKAENTDYTVFVVIDDMDQLFVTSSPSFEKSFVDIFNEMNDYPEEEYSVECFRVESKNYKGKSFINCRVI